MPHNVLDSTLLGCTIFNSLRLRILLIFAINQALLEFIGRNVRMVKKLAAHTESKSDISKLIAWMLEF